MDDKIITELIDIHLKQLVDCCSSIDQGLTIDKPDLTFLQSLLDDEACPFTRLLDSGRVHFNGAIANDCIHHLHAAFHTVAALTLELLVKHAPSEEILSYRAELGRISGQLVTVLKGARIEGK